MDEPEEFEHEGRDWLATIPQIVVVTGLIWVAARTVLALWGVWLFQTHSGSNPSFLPWLQALDQIGYAAFLVGLGIYGVLWLRERRDADHEDEDRA